MEVIKELFVIPEEENYILYAPLEERVLRVKPEIVSFLNSIIHGERVDTNSELVKLLIDNHIIVDGVNNTVEGTTHFTDGDWRNFPQNLTLFPTRDCQLRCKYCYSSAGNSKNMMPFEIAKAAIDLVLNNVVAAKKSNSKLVFHGGGEPFFNWSLVRDATAYAKGLANEYNIDLDITATTNGVLNRQQLEWIVENFKSIGFSFDGPGELQDGNRPFASGKGSSKIVQDSITYMEEKQFNYGIRSTITPLNVGKMKKIVDFLVDFCPSRKLIHFEPVFKTGRSFETGMESPDPNEFLTNLIAAKNYASSKGINIFYSGGNVGRVKDHFCGALGSNFYVTPEGLVTSCFEVSDHNDPRFKLFGYGRYINGKFEIDMDKLKALSKRKVGVIDRCTDCFAKYNCAGDCPAKMQSLGDMYSPTDDARCAINRALVKYQLTEMLNDK